MLRAYDEITKCVALFLLSFACIGAVGAQNSSGSYPRKTVRMIVPFPPGGGTDIVTRAVGMKLTQSLGQTIVVDNRGGANANIGAELVAKAPADGYTLLVGTANLTVNVSLYPKLAYDVRKDFVPITLFAAAPLVFATHPSLRVRNVSAFIALAKQDPGRLNYSSTGSGSPPHLAAELFKSMAGIDMTHLPYSGGGPAVVALMGNQAQVMFGSMPTIHPHLQTGKVSAIAVTSLKRSAMAPDLPTIAESGLPGYEMITWYGLLAPANTPVEIIGRLYSATKQALAEPEVQSVLLAQGFDVVGNTSEEFSRMITSEIRKFAKIVKQAGAKVD